mmetsp:Transcript_14035/g.25427  ORF Transcript_14035/g.25427 Transcript_14035/m.25427 type:complete len:91 (-) Transcript_14035:61-333(-)
MATKTVTQSKAFSLSTRSCVAPIEPNGEKFPLRRRIQKDPIALRDSKHTLHEQKNKQKPSLKILTLDHNPPEPMLSFTPTAYGDMLNVKF